MSVVFSGFLKYYIRYFSHNNFQCATRQMLVFMGLGIMYMLIAYLIGRNTSAIKTSWGDLAVIYFVKMVLPLLFGFHGQILPKREELNHEN